MIRTLLVLSLLCLPIAASAHVGIDGASGLIQGLSHPMTGAGALGMAGVTLPLAETGIGLSVVALGLAVAFEINPPTLAAAVLIGVFAIFHGHAHGAEMPHTASGLAYGAGFLFAVALIYVFGVALGLLIGRTSFEGRRIVQAGGAAISLAGMAILTGIM